MADGRERSEWNRTCAAMALMLNLKRKEGARLVKAEDLHPMNRDPLVEKAKPQEYGDITILKHFLRK